MAVTYRTNTETVPVRPALVTVIGVLELAAAVWDSRIFLRFSSLFPSHWGSTLSLDILIPALMAIAAIYAGVGLLKMHRSAWNVWFARHACLSAIYLMLMPGLLYQSMFCPGLSLVITWRFMIVVFSLVAGIYLYAVRGCCDNPKARAAR